MRDEQFEAAIAKILEDEPKLPAEVYRLMPAVLDYTQRKVRQATPGAPLGHVSARQLSEGFRDYLLAEFGPFAAPLLLRMRMNTTDDIGMVVYNLIRAGVFGRSAEDKFEDFHALYDFNEAFVYPFDPDAEAAGVRVFA